MCINVDYNGHVQPFRIASDFVFGDLSVDAAFFFGVQGDWYEIFFLSIEILKKIINTIDNSVLRDEDNAVWPNSAEVGSMLSIADDVMIVLNFIFYF